MTTNPAERRRLLSEEVAQLLSGLEAISGRRVSGDALRESARRFAHLRFLQRELYRLRRETPGVIRNADFYAVLKAGFFLPVEEYNPLLENLLTELKSVAASSGRRARVVLSGMVFDPLDAQALFDSAGVDVVDDDFSSGWRSVSKATCRWMIWSPASRRTCSAALPAAASTIRSGIAILKKSGKQFVFPVDYGQNLQSEHERFLTEEHFKSPTTLFNYPREIKPFYMRLNDDAKTVTAMDVLVPGIGEVIGGAQREERLDQLHENMKFHKLRPEDYWWYTDLRKYGNGAARRVRSRLRAAAHVPHGRVEHPRRDPLCAHSRERRVLTAVRWGRIGS